MKAKKKKKRATKEQPLSNLVVQVLKYTRSSTSKPWDYLQRFIISVLTTIAQMWEAKAKN